jgi:hypothetical protein
MDIRSLHQLGSVDCGSIRMRASYSCIDRSDQGEFPVQLCGAGRCRAVPSSAGPSVRSPAFKKLLLMSTEDIGHFKPICCHAVLPVQFGRSESADHRRRLRLSTKTTQPALIGLRSGGRL